MSFEENQHVIDLLPAFVVNALTEDETYQVGVHLEKCPECREELRFLQEVADDLPLALQQKEPPAQLKNNILLAVHEKQIRAHSSIQPETRQKSGFSFQKFIPVFGLAAFLVLVFVNVILWRQLYLTNHPYFQSVALANTQNSPGASGELVMDRSGQYGTLVVDNLAELANTNQYQVWLIQDGSRTSGGVFSVNPDGYAALEIYAPLPLKTYDAIGITVEPFGGSSSPTGTKVLGGDIPR